MTTERSSSGASMVPPESGVYSMRTTAKDPGVHKSALSKLKNTLGNLGMQKRYRSDTDITSLVYSRHEKLSGADDKSQTDHSCPRSRPSFSPSQKWDLREEIKKHASSHGSLGPAQNCTSKAIRSAPPKKEKSISHVGSCSTPSRSGGIVDSPRQSFEKREYLEATNVQGLKLAMDLELLCLKSKQDSVKAKVWTWLQSIPVDADGEVLEETDSNTEHDP
ncbi:hypothetical protein MPTK1_4g14900 [Marchantia polymorpha subsp. ruderalis]|uniref:Uncharacterized protein n=2 Tax=Marchantia polymorpha TaxID=3197 RepID=A0AAF6BA04_MARPO|nr:hypothetical protein MARPO_0119s0013 [Marchantia polymorpha]BBN08838.1 hypothetical protein Mp_4g14900 [Marchantia polymorpha subsp. ruderalis]|eukprot:PTQ30803.1 hypothetical protein MARPO_0119s0013 [Marchantia polymorpha]